MSVYCLEHVYPALPPAPRRRAAEVSEHRSAQPPPPASAELSWAQGALHHAGPGSLFTAFVAQKQDDAERSKWFFLTWGPSMKAFIIICPVHGTQGMLPGSYTLQCISPSTAANSAMLQCFRKIANRSWSDCTELHISHHTQRYRQNKSCSGVSSPPFLPQTTDNMTGKSGLWDFRGPVTKNWVSSKEAYYITVLLLFLIMPLNKVVVVEQPKQFSLVWLISLNLQARHLQCRSRSGQRADSLWKIWWQIRRAKNSLKSEGDDFFKRSS